ncbi:MAG TPA: SDR family oxidoreductase [Beijerinckiaceae bacterium]|jgi:3-oxoacyl-[acyl-carrier protein] reductase
MPGRRAIVTGASKGIGRAIARLLAGRGYAVALVARSQDLLEALARELGAAAVPLPADLRDASRAPGLVEAAAARLGGLDLLVNCAGATKRGDIFALGHEDFLDGFALKFHGAVAMTRAAWPHLRRDGAGHVVNIIGAAARTPSADFAIGGAVNSALENFTKAMADRGLADKVRVNAINPGPIETDRLGTRIAQVAAEMQVDEDTARARMIADQRVIRFGRPEEVAELVAFMDSPAGAFLHGAVIELDGGATKGL